MFLLWEKQSLAGKQCPIWPINCLSSIARVIKQKLLHFPLNIPFSLNKANKMISEREITYDSGTTLRKTFATNFSLKKIIEKWIMYFIQWPSPRQRFNLLYDIEFILASDLICVYLYWFTTTVCFDTIPWNPMSGVLYMTTMTSHQFKLYFFANNFSYTFPFTDNGRQYEHVSREEEPSRTANMGL